MRRAGYLVVQVAAVLLSEYESLGSAEHLLLDIGRQVDHQIANAGKGVPPVQGDLTGIACDSHELVQTHTADLSIEAADQLGIGNQAGSELSVARFGVRALDDAVPCLLCALPYSSISGVDQGPRNVS